MKTPMLSATLLVVAALSAPEAAGELFPAGRLIDTNPSAAASAIAEELAQGRDALVDSASRTTDFALWRLSQRFAIYVSQINARYGNEVQPYSKLPPGEQTIIRDGYLMTELIDGYLDGSIADTSLAARTIEEATQRLATTGQAPSVLGCDRLWIIPSQASDNPRVTIEGVGFHGTDEKPYLQVDDMRLAPAADSSGGLVSFELPADLASPEGGVGVQWVEFVAFERRKRGLFRSEIVPMATRIPIFVLPRFVASFVMHAEVDVSTSEERPRRSFPVRVEGVGQEKSDSICLKAKAGAEIIPSSVEIHKVSDESWAPDPVLPGQWIRADGSRNVFEKSASTKRACVTVTAKPVNSAHMAVAEAYMEFSERVGTTATETRDFQFDLGWGLHHEFELPENTTKYRVETTFFDGTSATFEGAETHRWVLVTWNEANRTLTFSAQSP